MVYYYKLLSDYGVTVSDGFVLDAEGAISEQNPTIFAGNVKEHDITSELSQTAPVIIQASKKGLYLNIPKKVIKQMDIEKGETAIIEVIDKDTMQIKFIEE